MENSMKNTTLLAIGVAAILAIAIAPALAPTEVDAARKTKCDQNPGSPNLGSSCPGNSGEKNKNREECHSNSENSDNHKCVGN
jgi:hypothetical protein